MLSKIGLFIACMILAIALPTQSNAQFGKALSGLIKKKDKKENTGKDAKKSNGKIATPHSGNFTDEYGVSGTYHLWRPWVFLYQKPSTRYGKEKEAHAITLEYDAETRWTKLYFMDEDHLNVKLSGHDYYSKNLWKGHQIYSSELDGKNQISATTEEGLAGKDVHFLQLEEGVMIVGYFRKMAKAPWGEIEDKYIPMLNIMAKDSSTLVGLTEEKVKEMCLKRLRELCKKAKDVGDGQTKLPARGLNTTSLVAEAHSIMNDAAAADDAGDWSSRHMYTYIQSKDWGVTYARGNSTPLHRRIAIIGVGTSKDQEGKCFYQVGWLQQNWNGEKYSATFFSGFGGGKVTTTCENALEYQQ